MSPPDAASLAVSVLLVEDSEDDAYIAKHAFAKSNHARNVTVHVARNGVEALQFLRNETPFEDAPKPVLILLDLNMPRMDGRELLLVVKNDPMLKRIPVIVLTTSDWPVDIETAYESQANSYFIKPVDLHTFTQRIGIFSDYWFNVATLPRPAGPPVGPVAVV